MSRQPTKTDRIGKTVKVIWAIISDNSQGALNYGFCYSTLMLSLATSVSQSVMTNNPIHDHSFCGKTLNIKITDSGPASLQPARCVRRE